MKDPFASQTTAAGTATSTSSMDALTATLSNSIQALGRGFDVTADIRLLYCKGTPGSRLIQLDDAHTRDLVLTDGVMVPNVPDDIQCSSDNRATENVPVCTFHKVILELFFLLVLFLAFFWSTLFIPSCICPPECLLLQFFSPSPACLHLILESLQFWDLHFLISTLLLLFFSFFLYIYDSVNLYSLWSDFWWSCMSISSSINPMTHSYSFIIMFN